jgi:ribulose-5-phosphate 4-epimerase/fuculose-1-phosphate aldolase
MLSSETAIRERICRLAESLFARGFTVGSSGNISVKVDEGFLITPTNSCFASLDPAKISKLDIVGRHIAGDKPSKEQVLHQAFYETRASCGAVVHLHSTYATARSCLIEIDPEDCVPPITPYVVMRVGPVKLLPYVKPGDPRMGDMIRALGGIHASVLLANHGPVVSGTDLEAAVYAAEELEETARLLFTLRGHPVRQLTDEQVRELNETFGRS